MPCAFGPLGRMAIGRIEMSLPVDIVATALFVIATMLTPGPNNILSTSMGAMYGYRRTIPFILGISVGFLLLMTLCATISVSLNSLLPSILVPLRIAGATYVAWLALSVYRGSVLATGDYDNAKPLRFLNGFVLQFMNPKAILYGLTCSPRFWPPY